MKSAWTGEKSFLGLTSLTTGGILCTTTMPGLGAKARCCGCETNTPSPKAHPAGSPLSRRKGTSSGVAHSAEHSRPTLLTPYVSARCFGGLSTWSNSWRPSGPALVSERITNSSFRSPMPTAAVCLTSESDGENLGIASSATSTDRQRPSRTSSIEPIFLLESPEQIPQLSPSISTCTSIAFGAARNLAVTTTPIRQSRSPADFQPRTSVRILGSSEPRADQRGVPKAD